MSKQIGSTNNPTGDISKLNISFTERNGLTLVAREHAIECINKIFDGAFRFLRQTLRYLIPSTIHITPR